MLISKEKYKQIKEIVLYLFGLSFFYNFDISKIFLSLMILFILKVAIMTRRLLIW